MAKIHFFDLQSENLPKIQDVTESEINQIKGGIKVCDDQGCYYSLPLGDLDGDGINDGFFEWSADDNDVMSA